MDRCVWYKAKTGDLCHCGEEATFALVSEYKKFRSLHPGNTDTKLTRVAAFRCPTHARRGLK